MTLHKQFPEVVSTNSSYNTSDNKWGCYLVTFTLKVFVVSLMITDNFSHGRPIRTETRVDVFRVLDRFIEIIGNISRIKTFVMDYALSTSLVGKPT